MKNGVTHGSLFSGIGGFDLAAEQVGWTNLFHCEWNPFCRRVLDYHFPNSESYEDIKATDFRKWQGKVDVLSGGFPCQPFSTSGLRKGSTDDRYLWPEMLRAIEEIRPTWVVGENVAGLLSMVHPSENAKMESSQNLFGESYEVYEQRDDGLPRELDSITFPRWRTESVKAYGNAIVPEVARRIFECIDQLSED